MHDAHAVRFGGELRERLRVGRARVDHQRLARLARERDLRGERPLLVGDAARPRGRSRAPSRRSPGSARARRARAARPGRRRRSPSPRSGGDRSPRTPAGSPPPRPAPRGTKPRRCRPSGSARRPPPLAAATSSASGGSHSSRCVCESIKPRHLVRRPRRPAGPSGTAARSRSTRSIAPVAERRAGERQVGRAERGEQPLGARRQVWPQQHRHAAQALGERAQDDGRDRSARASSLASCHGACSST